MFGSIDEIILFLEEYKKVEWQKSKKVKDENGNEKTIMGYPMYDKRVTDIIKYIKETYNIDDKKYIKFVEEKWYDWDIKDLDKDQLVNKVFFIYQSERFCAGLIGRNIEDGTLLEIFRLLKQK